MTNGCNISLFHIRVKDNGTPVVTATDQFFSNRASTPFHYLNGNNKVWNKQNGSS
jgi:hypothetical protein